MRRLLVILGIAGALLCALELGLLVTLAVRATAVPVVPTLDARRIAALATIPPSPSPSPSPTSQPTQTPSATPTDLPPTASPTETTPAQTESAQAVAGLATPSATRIPSTPHMATLVHVVQPGETLTSIAELYGVSVGDLLALNDLSDANLIAEGQRLFVAVLVTDTPVPSATPSRTFSPLPTLDDLGILTATPTASQTPTPTYTPTPTPPPLPTMIIGLPTDLLILIDDTTRAHIREIYALGQELGNNPHAFSKIGDSTIENPHFMTRFDSGPYNLGEFAALQPMIDYYHGSFSRQGVAIKRGMNSWVITDPMWADPTQCEPNEGPLACEIRLNRPSVAFIRLGTNDVGSEGFRENMRQVIQYCLDHGVIPLIGTKADRYRDEYNQVNAILRELAAEYHVPLWDFDRASQILPDHGMTDDGTHLTTFFTHDYRASYALWTGYGLHNILAMMTLDQVWREVTPPEQRTEPPETP